MKKTLFIFSLLVFTNSIFSQIYEFQTIKDIEGTPVISQDQTGTCWSFSTTSFLESEIIRLTGKKINLSEMYTVRSIYPKKAWNYVMRQGKAQFGEGGLAHDVINSAVENGVVPENIYTGLTENQATYNHAEMVAVMEAMLKVYITNPGKKLSPQWKEAIASVLDVYLGEIPTDFIFDGKKYTPKSFFESLKINPNAYITISSFSHEPIYKSFVLDIPDNFSNGKFYNLPLEEYVENIDNALENGYTLSLDCDVSEATFSGKNGIAVIPANDEDAKLILTEIKPEKNISVAYRQAEFENFATQDDHLMHIIGKVKDQKGTQYYKVKNSWGLSSKNKGFVYMSVAYLKLKSISVLLHKDGLLKKTKTNLGL